MEGVSTVQTKAPAFIHLGMGFQKDFKLDPPFRHIPVQTA